MNAEAKFVSSVMDARLKKVRRERDSFRKQRDELINDMAETKRKAEAFDEIDRLITNGVEKERDTQLIFQNICHVIINLKESGDIIYESKEANNEG
ncbi:hypothetical protein LZU21_06960 [Staphylococcus epidermidis]|jgi:hypothetical protein|uniref:hypothetical protein n=1 Tax=Staphylococcus epidermidis TaxID=1282 RepID=UPI00138DEA97|nr:hypothetical protein [Staphylococcus epidermidis]MCO6345085.1 hypothetical protein [Staphylococcus epidermidis]DAY23875.1 MAG TPA: Protein of unknown function (DUF1024) [Caudoviricetes sp.]